jgi:TRAP-type mannitol/chloroaromatic compound transport system permease small subunit
MMQALLGLSQRIDRFSGWVGRHVSWLIVVAIVVSALNAIIRKLFNDSSNAWLEIQWWLFAAVFLLAAPWTLRDNEHIRIDVVSSHLTAKWKDRIELLGHGLFLLPVALLLAWTSWKYFSISWLQNEQSRDAGGLPQWPIKGLIPFAFALLALQAVSELIKRVAVMGGVMVRAPHDHSYHQEVTEAGVETHEAHEAHAAAGKRPHDEPAAKKPVVSKS